MNQPLCTITVHGKPVSTNAMYGTARNGRRYLTKAARAWKKIVCEEAWLAWLDLHRTDAALNLIGETMRVHCVFFGVAADVDNLLKCTLDGLKDGIGIDDRYFQAVKATRGRRSKSAPAQGAVITVWAESIETLFSDQAETPEDFFSAKLPFLEPETIKHLEAVVDRAVAEGLRRTLRRAS